MTTKHEMHVTPEVRIDETLGPKHEDDDHTFWEKSFKKPSKKALEAEPEPESEVTNLDAAIEEAREADAQISKLDALRSQAESLKRLEAQKAKEQELVALTAQLEQVKAGAKSRLATAAVRASIWRGKYQAAIETLDQCEIELPPIQHEIIDPGVGLKNATLALYYFQHPYNPQAESTSNVPPGEWAAQGAFSEAWAEVGGNDPNLDTVMPAKPGSLAAVVGDSIPPRIHLNIYNHGVGARFFRPR